jgi:hypothetical protein
MTILLQQERLRDNSEELACGDVLGRDGGSMKTVKLRYKVQDEFANRAERKIEALRNKVNSTRAERSEAEIDVATESLADYAAKFNGTIGDVEFNSKTNVQSVAVNFDDPQLAKKFDAYMKTNPPAVYRLTIPTLSKKRTTLQERMNPFVGKTVKEVRVGTRKQVVRFHEILWVDDGFEAELAVWVLFTFTDKTSVAFEAENHGFQGWGAAAAASK